MDGCETLETSFEAIARKWGADIYPLDIKKINPIQSIRLKCQVPLCEYYDVCKTCPPHIPDVAVFREALLSYSKAFLKEICQFYRARTCLNSRCHNHNHEFIYLKE